MYDLIVLGGGPGGYETAKLAGNRGLKTILIEENDLGGTCLNRGCIPLKTFLHTARIKDDYGSALCSGLLSGSRIRLNQNQIKNYKNSTVKALQRGIYGMEKDAGVIVIKGRGSIKICEDNHIVVGVGNEDYEAQNLVIATGSEENRLPFETGKLSYKIIYSDEFLDIEDIPERVVIVGGGAIGIECASYMYSAGSNVTIVEAQEHIGSGLDSEIGTAFERILKKKGINVLTGHAVKSFNSDGITVGSEVIPADCVLLSIGRHARIESVRDTGVKIVDGCAAVDQCCKTNINGVYACGDVTGKLMLAHAAYAQARVIVDDLMGRSVEGIEYRSIPRIIYSNPEVLTVGLTETDCKNMGLKYEAKSMPMTYSGKYFAEHGKDGAIAKMIAADGKLLGYSMIGNGAAEIGVAAEMMIGMRIHDIRKIVFPHPAIGEIIHELIGMFHV